MLITLSLGLKVLTKSYPNLDPVDQSHGKESDDIKSYLNFSCKG